MHIMNPSVEYIAATILEDFRDDEGNLVDTEVQDFLSDFTELKKTLNANNNVSMADVVERGGVVHGSHGVLRDGSIIYELHFRPRFSFTGEDGYEYAVTEGNNVYSYTKYVADMNKALEQAKQKLDALGYNTSAAR